MIDQATAGPIIVLVALVAVGMVTYAMRFKFPEDEVDLRRPTQFKEPGCGRWMSCVVEEWYALSDSGGSFNGGPWPTMEAALLATRGNDMFMREYGLGWADVCVPGWSETERAWDNNWAVCNIISSKNLYNFWTDDVAFSKQLVEVR